MQINSNNTYPQHSFTGLTRMLSKSVYNSDRMIDSMVKVYPKSEGFVGNFPKEIISAIKAHSNSKDEIANKISILKETFSDVSSGLRNEISRKIVDNAKIYLKQDMSELMFDELTNSELHARMIAARSVSNARKNILSSPVRDFYMFSQKMTKTCKDLNIIPKDGKVELSYIGGGTFGEVFNLSFKDNNKNKIFHDKALKIYHSKKFLHAPYLFSAECLLDNAKSMSKEEYIESVTQYAKKENYGSSYLEDISTHYDELIEKLPLEFDYIIGVDRSNWHGCKAEANAALYIQKSAGHSLINSNIIKPYVFDLDKGYSLTEMADNEISVKKGIDPKYLGLHCYDTHQDNFVNDILIDFGGIKITDERLVKDKVYRRNYKIKNRDDYLQNHIDNKNIIAKSYVSAF